MFAHNTLIGQFSQKTKLLKYLKRDALYASLDSGEIHSFKISDLVFHTLSPPLLRKLSELCPIRISPLLALERGKPHATSHLGISAIFTPLPLPLIGDQKQLLIFISSWRTCDSLGVPGSILDVDHLSILHKYLLSRPHMCINIIHKLLVCFSRSISPVFVFGFRKNRLAVPSPDFFSE
jgi:hypothetical protein